MERIAFKLRLREGKREIYKKMHDEIWPEMLDVLETAKIQNYTIWNSGEDLFGYYEVPDSDYSNRILGESEVVSRWNIAMNDIYYPDIDPDTGTVREMHLMFKFKTEE